MSGNHQKIVESNTAGMTCIFLTLGMQHKFLTLDMQYKFLSDHDVKSVCFPGQKENL